MNITPAKLMRFGNKGRLAEAYTWDAFNLLAYNRKDIQQCGGWVWMKHSLLSLILWWIDQDPREAEAWMARYIAIRDLR